MSVERGAIDVRSIRLVLCFFGIVSATWAQSASTSQISGTVHDLTGASIPAATVKVVQTDTGFMRSAVTSTDGAYLLPNLPIGPYRMEVTKEGFSTFVDRGIVLEVNTNPAINPTLKVGAISEQITVQAEALAVETHSTGVGQVIDHQEVVDLPLNAREPTQLILLAGVATTQGANAADLNTNKNFPTITISVAGGNANQIAFSLDGATANNPFNGLNQPLPFPDALQEFKVETSSVGAQAGQHAAASVTVATRSGTNATHGNFFEYNRYYVFNGRTATALVRDSLKQNQFGGTIGGAIIKNKLFYFAGAQVTIKRSNPADQQGFSMTPDMLAGNFQVIASTQCQPKQITLAAPFVKQHPSRVPDRSDRGQDCQASPHQPAQCLRPGQLRDRRQSAPVSDRGQGGLHAERQAQHVRALYAVEQLHSIVFRPGQPAVYGKHNRSEEQHSVRGDRGHLCVQPQRHRQFPYRDEPRRSEFACWPGHLCETIRRRSNSAAMLLLR